MGAEEYNRLLAIANTEKEKLEVFATIRDDDEVSFAEMSQLMDDYPYEEPI